MKPIEAVDPVFVEEIPRTLEAGKLYVSIAYDTVTHLCCCGCANEVVTPLHPTRWSLTYDGDTVSLHPSVGSWGLPCRSHYLIKRNRVVWASRWSEDKIGAGRARDAHALDEYFSARGLHKEPDDDREVARVRKGRSRLRRLWRSLRRTGG
jgi:hypothetical protein